MKTAQRRIRWVWLGRGVNRTEMAEMTGEGSPSAMASAIIGLYLPRWAGLRTYAFELAATAAWLVTGITNLLDPSQLVHSPVGRNVGFDAVFWSILFILGSVGIVAGIARAWPAARVAGLLVLSAGLLMQTVAALSFDLTPRAVVPLFYATAALVRVWMLVTMIRRVRDAPSP